MNENEIISATNIILGIPEQWRPTFGIVECKLSPKYKPVIESLWIAIKLFASISRLSTKCKIILGKSPFIVELGANGKLTFTSDDAINIAIENLIFIDVKKLLPLKPRIRVATIIEEFVHALMDVEDERLTSNIVALIHKEIKVLNGAYF